MIELKNIFGAEEINRIQDQIGSEVAKTIFSQTPRRPNFRRRNFDQPRLHGIKALSDKFAGKVAFSCAVDIQEILPEGNKKLIRKEANDLVRYLNHNGGFIAKIYHWEDEGLDFDPGEYSKEVFNSIHL